MFCTHCGSRVPDGMKFCTKCGHELHKPKEPAVQAAAPTPVASFGMAPDAKAALDSLDAVPGSVPSSAPRRAEPYVSASAPSGQGAAASLASRGPLPLRSAASGPGYARPAGAGPSPAPVAPRPAPYARPATASESQPAKRSSGGAIAVIVISVLVILFAGGAAAYYFGIHLPEQDKMAATRAADAEYDLVIQVEAPGWETSTGGSRLPVQVTGEDRDGKKVDEVQYVDSNGEGLKLKQGSYTLAVAASPFTADGGLFEENGTTIDVSFENLKEGEEVDLRKNGGFELMPLDPAETSDDQIDKAYDLASDDDAEGAPDASALRQKAVDLRKDALF